MKNEKKNSPNPEQIEEVLKADLERTDTFILKKIDLRQNRYVVAARTSGEEIKTHRDMKLESHGQNRKSFPPKKGAGKNGWVHWGGGWHDQQCRVSGATRQLQPHQYRHLVSPTLRTQLLSFDEMRIYCDVSNGHEVKNNNSCEIPSGQESTHCAQTWSLLAFHNIAQGFLKSNF